MGSVACMPLPTFMGSCTCNGQSTDPTSTIASLARDEMLVSDLMRGRGRSIGGDINVGEEGSEQTIINLQSLHHGSYGYQHAHTRVDLAKKAYPCKCN
jgi:hypothetical protein